MTLCGRETPEHMSFDVAGEGGGAYRIKIMPALSDNYMYLIISDAEHAAVVVDPVEPSKVIDECQKEGVRLSAVLTTHYHSDHSGGNQALAEKVPGIVVMAGELDADRTPAVSRRLTDGEEFVMAGLNWRCVATPCHTRGHVCYFLDAADGQAPALFCGDTLFVGGCGRFMEGGAGEMKASLDTLTALPPQTRVFCGHEYGVENMTFATAIDPASELLAARLREMQQLRTLNLPTVPSTLAAEVEHNLFLRVGEPWVAQRLECQECADSLDVMARLRRRKDTFTTVGKLITLALDVKGAVLGK